jgi:alkylated DNA repair dioxygenase AlkB
LLVEPGIGCFCDENGGLGWSDAIANHSSCSAFNDLAASYVPDAAFLLSPRHPIFGDASDTTSETRLPDQFPLLADAPVLPEGLRYAAEFIPASVERELIDRVAALPLQPFQFGQYEGKRRVASFGWRYDYSQRRLSPAEPIPDWLAPLIEQIEAFGRPETRIDQVLCTEYEAGVGIGWHRDKQHFGRIFGVSLGSSCRLRFRRPAGERWERAALDIAPRSIYAMSARPVWSGSTASRRSTPCGTHSRSAL